MQAAQYVEELYGIAKRASVSLFSQLDLANSVCLQACCASAVLLMLVLQVCMAEPATPQLHDLHLLAHMHPLQL